MIPLVPMISAVQGAALREILIAALLIVLLRYNPRPGAGAHARLPVAGPAPGKPQTI